MRPKHSPGRAQGSTSEAHEADLVGRSSAFVALLRRVRRVAACRLPVLITGESGSGKEGIARAVHVRSPRRAGPFLAVNCAAFPESLLESELFGAARGAYTGSDHDRPGLFRLAHGGTLFLDEIGDMPLAMQAKLLRVLQDGRVRPVGARSDFHADVRIVAATHRSLPDLVAEGRFRQDLYYRIAVIELRVPSLKERIEDLPLLVEHLASRLASEAGLGPVQLTPTALDRLRGHDWPGNVRELEAILARAALRTDGLEISARHLDLRLVPSPAPPRSGLERAMIETALLETGGNVAGAARRIGWSRPKLYRRMAALGIDKPAAARRREA